MKYKLYIRQYDITTNDYKVREEIVETNDVYHEIGKIYSTAFTEIKRIDYQKIDETKELKKEIERLNNIIKGLDNTIENLEEVIKHKDSIIKEVREYAIWQKENPTYDNIWREYEVNKLLEILKGSD